MTISPSLAPRQYPGRLFLALGFGLALLGIGGYVVQIYLRRLTAPWYLPISATLGVVLLAVALWQARSVWRYLGLLLLVLLAGAEWTFLLGTRLPTYSGPVAQGQPFPEFTTVQADGTTFTQRDLQGDKNSVFVFFRGRW